MSELRRRTFKFPKFLHYQRQLLACRGSLLPNCASMGECPGRDPTVIGMKAAVLEKGLEVTTAGVGNCSQAEEERGGNAEWTTLTSRM